MENHNSNQPPSIPPSNVSVFERITNSVILKLFVIFILTLLMLIPMTLINDLVQERKSTEQNVSYEIGAKWGTDQVVVSPILAVPFDYVQEVIETDSKGQPYKVKSTVEEWVFLYPNTTNIKTNITPEYLKRGIYQSVVYNSTLELKGKFGSFNLNEIPVSQDRIKWAQAKLIFGVTDVKGLTKQPELQWGDKQISLAATGQSFELFPNHLIANLPLAKAEDTQADFTIKLNLRGSKSLNFLPVANQTNITATGTWANPSFNGGYLPEKREVLDSTFSAQWSVPSFARKQPQQWLGQNQRIYSFSGILLSEEYFDVPYTESSPNTVSASADVATAVSSAVTANNVVASRFNSATDLDMVQINFLTEVNNYQKTTRVAKYGILIIILTFASLFFTEIIKKQRIHLVQYILIGAAMALFYSLLLAISEHLTFNWAYIISALATLGLIASFLYGITKDRKIAYLFAAILALFYSFIFVLMQLKDYSLIVGTIGIFIILAVLMRISTKINWYQFDRK